ncbi:MAG: hypothetical protein GY774_32965, partial [Planctomycetes bacterium]|nr:hypothetical protein [Planctomycetota bacterium]
NRQITRAELLAEEVGKQQDMSDEEKMQVIAQIASDPRNEETVKQNDVSQLDVDILIEEAPDIATIQHEEFEVLSGLAQTRKEVPFNAVLEASQLRSDTKRKIKEALQPTDDPNAAMLMQLQQQMAQLEPLLKEAEVRKVAAQAAKDEATAAESAMDAVIKTATFIEDEDPETQTNVNVN